MKLIERIIKFEKLYGIHNRITFLGFIKITYINKNSLNIRKEYDFEKYKKNNFDITKIPPASGQVRKLQLANLELLKEFDYVCKKNNLEYWIDFGSLLGAIRHGGYIPWDDDIDVGLPRKDYNKLIEIFDNETRNKDLYIRNCMLNKKDCNYLNKVSHKKCNLLFLDIFPYDFLGEKLTFEQQEKLTKTIKEKRKIIKKKADSGFSDEEIKEEIFKLRKEILNNKEIDKTPESDLVWGVDFNHSWKHWVYSFDEIYPLNEIVFEGFKFPCVNQKEKYMSKVYGNYMSYPKKIRNGHNMYAAFSKEDMEIIDKLIGENK